MPEYEEAIRELAVEEYFYLSENLEPLNSATVSKGAKYLVYNKKKRLFGIVKKVMEEELTDIERSIALDYWCSGVAAAAIAKKNRIARSTVYRTIESARKKLHTSLKYVMMYEENLLPETVGELLEYVRNGKVTEEAKGGQKYIT